LGEAIRCKYQKGIHAVYVSHLDYRVGFGQVSHNGSDNTTTVDIATKDLINSNVKLPSNFLADDTALRTAFLTPLKN
jgi:hypothetical protein